MPLRRLLVLQLLLLVDDDDGMLSRQLKVCEAGDERLDDDEMQHAQLDSSSVSGLFSLSVALAFVEAEVDRVLLFLLLLLVNECVHEAEVEVDSVARNNDMAAAVAVAAEVSEQTSDSSTRLVGCCCERQPTMQQKKSVLSQFNVTFKEKPNIKGKQNKTKWK